MEHQLHAHECLPTCRSGNSLAPSTVTHHAGNQCCASPASCQTWSLCGSTGMTPGGHCNTRIVMEVEHVDSPGCILSTLSENLFHLTLLLNGHVMALAVGRGLSLRGPMFSSKPVHVGCVVDKGEQRQVFLPVLKFPLSVSFHHCFMYIYHQCYRNLTMDLIIK
jgi:hypothetical protein